MFSAFNTQSMQLLRPFCRGNNRFGWAVNWWPISGLSPRRCNYHRGRRKVLIYRKASSWHRRNNNSANHKYSYSYYRGLALPSQLVVAATDDLQRINISPLALLQVWWQRQKKPKRGSPAGELQSSDHSQALISPLGGKQPCLTNTLTQSKLSCQICLLKLRT